MKNMKKTQRKMHLVSHVHWDPAWYLPYEKYRIILVQLMKKLLKILDEQEEYVSFMFDGQVDAIDDYLAIIPSDKERIAKHVKSGKLIIGPWYIQPEEFIVSGETHIRNLLLGHKRAKELGGVMPISYLCDMVGHIAQMPQIIKGFDIDYFVGWRGIFDGNCRDRSELIWEAPDGSRVLLKVLIDGYYNLLPADDEGFFSKIEEIKNSLSPFTDNEYILVLQGADHNEPIENIPQLISSYNKRVGYSAIEHTTLEHHIDSLKKNMDSYKTCTGEMRAIFRKSAFILTGILTARMSIKLENERISSSLERWVEPFASIDSLLSNSEYPKELIDYVWLKQLKNSFHDCIYGAHVDEVTLDIFNDYKREMEIIEWITGEALVNISKRINTIGKDDNVTIFNPTPWERINAVVDFDIFLQEEKFKEFVIMDAIGNCLPMQISGVKPLLKYSGFSGNHWKQNAGVSGNLYSISVTIPSLPAFGYCNLELRKSSVNKDNSLSCRNFDSINAESDLKQDLHECENEYLLVKIRRNGLLDIYDKQAKTWYKKMNMLEDSGDAGDLYNFSVPKDNIIYLNCSEEAEISLVESGSTKVVYEIEQDWGLPDKLTSKNARSKRMLRNKVVTRVTLRAHSKIVEFNTKIDNRSKDHRIRAVFPTGLECKNVHSGSQFYVSERQTEKEKVSSPVEESLGNHPKRLFVDVSDGKKGVTFLDRGLTEYEAKPNGELYVTLLRCCGYLSKDGLKERSYCNAGPMYATPLAQELGVHLYDYALYFHEGDWKQGDSYRYSDEFYVIPKAIQGDAHSGDLPASQSFMKLLGNGVVLSAFKKAENSNNVIVRVYNVLNTKTDCCIEFINQVQNACHVNLNELPIEKLKVCENKINFSINSNQIYTIMLELEH
jgi:mannosylglycerate hydrolase